MVEVTKSDVRLSGSPLQPLVYW